MNDQMKKDFSNIQFLDWYVQGHRGEHPSNTFSGHVCKSFRHWLERMKEYPQKAGYFDVTPAAILLRNHYLANPHEDKNYWILHCMELEASGKDDRLRRLLHPKSETKIKAGDVVFLQSYSKLEKTIALRHADKLPKLDVTIPGLIPEDFKMNRFLDVCELQRRIDVTPDQVAHILPNGFEDAPTTKKCTQISEQVCKQLDGLFIEAKSKQKDRGLLDYETWSDYVDKEVFTSPDFGMTGFSGKLIRFDDDNLYVKKKGSEETHVINRADGYGSWFLEDR
jgi:hypothetical protein